MMNLLRIEEAYKEFIKDLPSWPHESIIDINLEFLKEEGILSILDMEEDLNEPDLSKYFKKTHGGEKSTWYNELFIVWIVQKIEQYEPITYVLIAINHPEKPVLDLIFATRGVYNSDRIIIELLKHFLLETLETEELIDSYEPHSKEKEA